DTLIFGEVGLTGEVRAVSSPEVRLKEGRKLGFARALLARRQQEHLGEFPGYFICHKGLGEDCQWAHRPLAPSPKNSLLYFLQFPGFVLVQVESVELLIFREH
ncbi:MAG: hypothetical protein Q8N13_16675, partial [Acidovorax sp.]|nr:hypothetical protein [Acidovorax sp.]